MIEDICFRSRTDDLVGFFSISRMRESHSIFEEDIKPGTKWNTQEFVWNLVLTIIHNFRYGYPVNQLQKLYLEFLSSDIHEDEPDRLVEASATISAGFMFKDFFRASLE